MKRRHFQFSPNFFPRSSESTYVKVTTVHLVHTARVLHCICVAFNYPNSQCFTIKVNRPANFDQMNGRTNQFQSIRCGCLQRLHYTRSQNTYQLHSIAAEIIFIIYFPPK